MIASFRTRIGPVHAGATMLLAALLAASPGLAAAPGGGPETAAPAPVAGKKPPAPDWLFLEPYTYRAGDPIPDGYVLVERRKTWPLVLGGSVFLTSYTSAMLVGGIGMFVNQFNPGGWAPMFIPVVGPFVTIATENAGASSDGAAGMLGVVGVVQALGLGCMISSAFFAPEKVLVPRTPYGDVRVVARRQPVFELRMPRLDIGRTADENGQHTRAFVALDGVFDL